MNSTSSSISADTEQGSTNKVIEIPDNFSSKFLEKHTSNRCVSLAWLSSGFQRSTNTLYTLAFGVAKSAKHMVLNTMFHQQIFTAEDFATNNIVLYSAKVKADVFNVSNFKFIVLETPEYVAPSETGKTCSSMMATISSYFKKKKCFPNYIVIAVNFSDPGVTDKDSNFNRMLQDMRMGLRSVIDGRHSNVFLALTHVSAKAKRQKDFLDKVDELISFARLQLGIFQLFAILGQCEEVGQPAGNYITLPSGRQLWYNVITCLDTIIRGVGKALVTEVLVHRRCQLDFQKTHITVSNDSLCMKELEPAPLDADVIPEEDKINDRLISYAAAHVSTSGSMDYAEELATMLKNAGYTNMSQLPKSDEVGKLMGLLSYLYCRISKDQNNLLKHALGVAASTLDAVGTYLGCQYSFFKGTLDGCMIRELPPVMSPIGCLLPSNVKAYEARYDLFTWCQKTKQEYVELKIRTLGLPRVAVPEKYLADEDGISFGYYVSDSTNQVAIRCTKSLYKLVLDHQKTSLNPAVEEELRSTIRETETSHKNSAEVWDRFFDDCGTHYVTSVELGGALHFVLSRETATKHFGNKVEGILPVDMLSSVLQASLDKQSYLTNDHAQFRVHGGTPIQLGISLKGDLASFLNWLNSVVNNFVPLEHTLTFEKMTRLVKREWRRRVEREMEDYFLRKLDAAPLSLAQPRICCFYL